MFPVFSGLTGFIREDNENGEKSIQVAPANPVPPDLPPKPGIAVKLSHSHSLRNLFNLFFVTH